MFLRQNIRKACHREAGCARYLSWAFGKNSRAKINNSNAVDTLKKAYREKLLPLEEDTHYHRFHSLKLNDADFDSSAAILLIGQYSTGKTTLIRHILQCDYPGIQIGPEPTTDRFITIMHDDKERIIPGNALVSDKTKPFAHLASYGNSFLTKFQCSTVSSPILKGIYIIDTPGILSGEKQRVDRGYDFPGVLEWFAERVDRIILLFDANKLDISDEFRNAIVALKGNEEKIRIVLNKADVVDPRSLMRVYGSLLWSLGKVINTPEVMKVFIGSFWDQPRNHLEFRSLFERDERALFEDIQILPTNSVLRKLNDLSKRARHVLVHARIMTSFSKTLPSYFGKEKAKNNSVKELKTIYEQVAKDYCLSPSEMPDLFQMQRVLSDLKASQIHAPKSKLIKEVEMMLEQDISRSLEDIDDGELSLQDGVFESMKDKSTPFANNMGVGFDNGKLEDDWIVEQYRSEADKFFDAHCAHNGKLPRSKARENLLASGLPNSVLGDIYALADIDGDGLLDKDEYALAKYIIQVKQEGCDLPRVLPKHLIPPSKL